MTRRRERQLPLRFVQRSRWPRTRTAVTRYTGRGHLIRQVPAMSITGSQDGTRPVQRVLATDSISSKSTSYSRLGKRWKSDCNTIWSSNRDSVCPGHWWMSQQSQCAVGDGQRRRAVSGDEQQPSRDHGIFKKTRCSWSTRRTSWVADSWKDRPCPHRKESDSCRSP